MTMLNNVTTLLTIINNKRLQTPVISGKWNIQITQLLHYVQDQTQFLTLYF